MSGEWMEIGDDRAFQLMKDSIITNAKAQLRDLKGIKGKAINMALKNVGQDQLEAEIIEKGISKVMSGLDDGKEITGFGDFDIKKENGVFYARRS